MFKIFMFNFFFNKHVFEKKDSIINVNVRLLELIGFRN